MRLTGRRFMIIADKHSSRSRRLCFRFKTKARPFTWSFTISRYVSRTRRGF